MHQQQEQAIEQVQDMVHRDPRLVGIQRSSWTLPTIQEAVPWLGKLSEGGACQLLHRLQVHWKRGRAWLHSPDLSYEQKMARLAQIEQLVRADPEHLILLFEDEITYYRRPRVGSGWAWEGSDTLLAQQGTGFNTLRRIAGCLDTMTGQFHSRQRSRFNVKGMCSFWTQIGQAYPQARTIYIALDNWPVHFAPQVQEAATANRIELLRLPTYAPWTNPVEKVWRKLSQEVLAFHRLAWDWEQLVHLVQTWLDQWTNGSLELLHSVGWYPHRQPAVSKLIC